MHNLLERDWFPLVAIASLYLIGSAIAPPVERLLGIWS